MQIADINALPDPCPLPGTIKRRGLNDKERLLYAPMADVGGLLYDKDAVYIDIPDWKVTWQIVFVGLCATCLTENIRPYHQDPASTSPMQRSCHVCSASGIRLNSWSAAVHKAHLSASAPCLTGCKTLTQSFSGTDAILYEGSGGHRRHSDGRGPLLPMSRLESVLARVWGRPELRDILPQVAFSGDGARAGTEGEQMVRDLQGSRQAVDEKLATSDIQLFGRPATGQARLLNGSAEHAEKISLDDDSDEDEDDMEGSEGDEGTRRLCYHDAAAHRAHSQALALELDVHHSQCIVSWLAIAHSEALLTWLLCPCFSSQFITRANKLYWDSRPCGKLMLRKHRDACHGMFQAEVVAMQMMRSLRRMKMGSQRAKEGHCVRLSRRHRKASSLWAAAQGGVHCLQTGFRRLLILVSLTCITDAAPLTYTAFLWPDWAY